MKYNNIMKTNEEQTTVLIITILINNTNNNTNIINMSSKCTIPPGDILLHECSRCTAIFTFVSHS